MDSFIWVTKFILPQHLCPLTPAQPFPGVPATRDLLSWSPNSPSPMPHPHPQLRRWSLAAMTSLSQEL